MKLVTAPPRSQQLAQFLRGEILAGRIAAGARLQAIRGLAQRFEVGRQVVVSAFEILAREGLIVRRPGCGTFVTPHGEMKHRLFRLMLFLPEPLVDIVAEGGFILGDLARGVIDEANRLGEVMIVDLPPAQDATAFIRTRIATTAADAVVLLAFEYLMELLKVAERNGKHCVLLNVKQDYGQGERYCQVLADEYGGICRAVGHLYELGHERLAYVGPEDLAPRTQVHAVDRLGAFRDSCLTAGRSGPDAPVVRWSAEGRRALRDLLGASARPTAIVAHTDRIAVDVMSFARQMGLRVPDDLSVTGFDDAPEARAVSPQLTTVVKPRVAMGAAAARLACNLVADRRTKPETVLLPTELVVRGSTVPPP